MYDLEESLIVFYTSNLNETTQFIDFLITQLSVRKRPKCLIVYPNVAQNSETSVMHILKFAWKKKFLDLTIMQLSNFTMIIKNSLSVNIYYFNPFNNIFYKKKFNKYYRLHPDKLKNGHGYSLHVFDQWIYDPQIATIVKPKKNPKFVFEPVVFFKFVSTILNLKWSYKETPIGSNQHQDFEEYRIDLSPTLIMGLKYDKDFAIPEDEYVEEYYAYVPIIPTSRADIYFKIFYSVIIILGLIFIFFYTASYFQNLSLSKIIMFDNVRLLLGQSIASEPKETSSRIVMLTVIVTSILIMNDLLSGIISLQFEKREIPFETFEDLYNSKLQTYTARADIEYIQKNLDDPYISEVLRRSVVDENVDGCFDTLIKWKNVSCVCTDDDSEWIILNYGNPDGSPAMKMAQPRLFSNKGFYMFPDGSPFALKFLEVMRRVREGSLSHWSILLYNHRNTILITENEVTFDDGINLELLVTILSFGFFVSIVAFISEFIISAACNRR